MKQIRMVYIRRILQNIKKNQQRNVKLCIEKQTTLPIICQEVQVLNVVINNYILNLKLYNYNIKNINNTTLFLSCWGF